MKFPKILLLSSCSLFLFIIALAILKPTSSLEESLVTQSVSVEKKEKPCLPKEKKKPLVATKKPVRKLPEKNQIHRLFAKDSSKLPIVETVSYTSRVPWLDARCAWIAEYASYYDTSRYFIARSLDKKTAGAEKLAFGDQFNVFSKEKNIEFHLLVDRSLSKMWFYYTDVEEQNRVLLKTYTLARAKNQKEKITLLPIGTYRIKKSVAVYKPGIMAYVDKQKQEMIRVFGTRVLPLQRIDSDALDKTYCIHGLPWKSNSQGKLIEDTTWTKKQSEDSLVLSSADIEELFSIVITKPTFVHVVNNFHDAVLPGNVEE